MTEQPTPAVSASVPSAAVQTSFKLWVLDAALGLVGLLTALPGSARLAVATVPAATSASPEPYMDRIADAMLLVALTAAVLFCAAQMRAGHNWARIVLTAYGALGLVGAALTLSTTIAMLSDGWDGAVMGGVTLIDVPLVIAAIVFMYLPAARDHFTRPRSGLTGQGREGIFLRVAIGALAVAALLWAAPFFMEGAQEGIEEANHPVRKQ